MPGRRATEYMRCDLIVRAAFDAASPEGIGRLTRARGHDHPAAARARVGQPAMRRRARPPPRLRPRARRTP